MRIANPSYNVVFKYLLEDEKVARLVLAALLGKEVLELQARRTGLRGEAPRLGGTLVWGLRMDFDATVRMEHGGSQPVLIEVRKARSGKDVLRYQRYLGSNDANAENFYLDAEGRPRALPIVTIYFLGEDLGCVDMPVLSINQHVLDAATGAEVRITGPFLGAPIHNAVLVQINRLRNCRRTDLERLLEVFDQDLVVPSDPHLLDIAEAKFPERHQEVLRRLMRAGADPEVRARMRVEDDLLAAFEDVAREATDLRRALIE